MLVLAYIWLPFVALPIFVSLETLDTRLLEAAGDLGATRLQAFLRITLPLSAPGIVAAFLFIFIPTVGEFVTPSLVGGTSGYMYGNQISDLFGTGFPDWRTGSVLALFLLAVVVPLTVVFSRSAGRAGRRADGRGALPDGRRLLRVLFLLVVVFLYAPIAILLLFSFNDSVAAVVPAERFHAHVVPPVPARSELTGALEDARDRRVLSSLGAVSSGRSASIALARRRFRAQGGGCRPSCSAPLVIPYVVFGIALLLLFHTFGFSVRC